MKNLIIAFTCLLSFPAISAPFLIELNTVDFNEILPISGSCDLDYDTGVISPVGSSQMCLPSPTGTPAHYRIVAAPNLNFNVRVNTRFNSIGDGMSFVPAGKITSDINDITISPGATHVVNSGTSGVINIKFGGRLTLNTAFAANSQFEILNDPGLVWSEVP